MGNTTRLPGSYINQPLTDKWLCILLYAHIFNGMDAHLFVKYNYSSETRITLGI